MEKLNLNLDVKNLINPWDTQLGISNKYWGSKLCRKG